MLAASNATSSKRPVTFMPTMVPATSDNGGRIGRRRCFVLARGAFDLADQALQLRDLFGESGAAGCGEADPGARPFAGITLLDGDQSGVLQHGEVLGQVARRQ